MGPWLMSVNVGARGANVMEPNRPCMAATLAHGAEPEYAASYHWCNGGTHEGTAHTCFCGKMWDSTDPATPLVTLTQDMEAWRKSR